jgi:hypothetical protein
MSDTIKFNNRNRASGPRDDSKIGEIETEERKDIQHGREDERGEEDFQRRARRNPFGVSWIHTAPKISQPQSALGLLNSMVYPHNMRSCPAKRPYRG